MYLKLALRNARRSVYDYYLYMTTMTILAAVLQAAEWTALKGKIQAGFQTASLPLLITLVLVLLAGYCNSFLWKQRAKEFANYLLLGMERSRLAGMLLAELLAVGLLCLAAGCILGLAGCGVFCRLLNIKMQLQPVLKSLGQTFLWFLAAQLLCALQNGRKLAGLQIRELLTEKRRNQTPGGKGNTLAWGVVFAGSMLCLTGFLSGIAFLPEQALRNILISIIAVPLFLAVFSFYLFFYQLLAAGRRKMAGTYRQDDGLYRIAQMTSAGRTDAVMNGVFCSCLLFSAASFGFGMLMLHPAITFFDRKEQQWMGFLQISICIIFLVIYFSILSLQQMIGLKQETENLRILYDTGRSKTEIKKLIGRQLRVRLTLPALMCIVPLTLALPFLDNSLNRALPAPFQHSILKAAALYFFLLLILYLFYFGVVNLMGIRQAERILAERN